MDQIALAIQNSVDGIGKIPADLAHPQPVCGSRDARDLHLARRQLDEEQHDEPLQPPPGPHFHGEEIRGHNQFPMPAQKLLPGRLPAALWRRLDPVPFQNLSDRAARNFVPQIGQCALDPPIAPIPFSSASRTTNVSISTAVLGRPGPRCAVPSYLLAISFRCQANKVSGVTMVATSAKSLRPNPLALAANRRRWSSLNRTRRPLSCSRRTRFSSRR